MDLHLRFFVFYGIKQRTDICCNLFSADTGVPAGCRTPSATASRHQRNLECRGSSRTSHVRAHGNILCQKPQKISLCLILFFAKSDYQFVYLRPALPQMFIQQMSAFRKRSASSGCSCAIRSCTSCRCSSSLFGQCLLIFPGNIDNFL